MVIKRVCLSLTFVFSLNSCTLIMDSSIGLPGNNGNPAPTPTPTPNSVELNQRIAKLLERLRAAEEERRRVVDETEVTPVCGKFVIPPIPPQPPMPAISRNASDDEFTQALVEYVVTLGNHSDMVLAKIRRAYENYSRTCNIPN